METAAHWLAATQALQAELTLLNYPNTSWVIPSPHQYEVVIIGAGMAGLCAAFALKRLGITRIALFDRAPKHQEGPWTTYAKMPMLRSGKDLVGPAQDLPALTFKSWFIAQQGERAWSSLYKIPTKQWMDYLEWYRDVLQLPVYNHHSLSTIQPTDTGLTLQINDIPVTTSKLILATGRAGFGGPYIPSVIKDIAPELYAHTMQLTDYTFLKDKRVGIIGAGASGFDAAATLLEQGALQVDLLLRRPHLPFINKAASLAYAGFSEGYYQLNDEQRWQTMLTCYSKGVPPPFEALNRVNHYPHFHVMRKTEIRSATSLQDKVHLETNRGPLVYDFLILATGFLIDGSLQPELKSMINQIQLWQDRPLPHQHLAPAWFKKSPYLGPAFQFTEKVTGQAPFLKNIHCFNYAATLSHGLLSGDIPGISVGAQRLARGIASGLFAAEWTGHHSNLRNYNTKELDENKYNFFV